MTTKETELQFLERFALRTIRDGRGSIGWYQLERVLPAEEFPHEDRNSVHILKKLEEERLVKPTNPDAPGSKWKYVVTEEGLGVLTMLGM